MRAALVVTSIFLAAVLCGAATVGASAFASGGTVSGTRLTPAAVVSAFAAVGLPLRRISVSPHPAGQVVLYYVNYKTFSLTVFVETSTEEAGRVYRAIGGAWTYSGWPSRLIRNVIAAVQPAGTKPVHAAMRPMPVVVSQALTNLARR
jgi:hypothetical protein